MPTRRTPRKFVGWETWQTLAGHRYDRVMSSPKINVLCLVSSLCVGGAEKHTVTLANLLNPSKFSVHLGYLKPVEALLNQVRAELTGRTFCLHVRKRIDFAAVSRLRSFIDSHDIDVIVATHEYPALYALMARRGARRIPRLIEVFHATGYLGFKSKLKMLLYRPLFKRCDLVVYVSEKQREYWRRNGLTGKRDIVIHNGVDLERFRDRSDPSQRVALRAQCGFSADDLLVGICAALRPEKAHGDLLLALARLRERGISAKALIVGDGPERSVIEQRIAALKLSRCVYITGFKDDVRPYLAICDVIVLASHAIETFSIAALEAMAMGKPLVLTRIGGAEEQVIAGQNGFLYEPGDIDALSGDLAELQLTSVRARMGAASRERVESLFSESRMMEQFEREIQALGRPAN
jgi:glycosyltransferase involved in cell wall biosynthesis